MRAEDPHREIHDEHELTGTTPPLEDLPALDQVPGRETQSRPETTSEYDERWHGPGHRRRAG